MPDEDPARACEGAALLELDEGMVRGARFLKGVAPRRHLVMPHAT